MGEVAGGAGDVGGLFLRQPGQRLKVLRVAPPVVLRARGRGAANGVL